MISHAVACHFRSSPEVISRVAGLRYIYDFSEVNRGNWLSHAILAASYSRIYGTSVVSIGGSGG